MVSSLSERRPLKRSACRVSTTIIIMAARIKKKLRPVGWGRRTRRTMRIIRPGSASGGLMTVNVLSDTTIIGRLLWYVLPRGQSIKRSTVGGFQIQITPWPHVIPGISLGPGTCGHGGLACTLILLFNNIFPSKCRITTESEPIKHTTTH